MTGYPRLLAAVAAALTLAACGGAAPGGGGSGGSAKAPDHITVGLALNPPKMVFIGFYVARDQGFFSKHNLDVSLAEFTDGVKSLKGLAGGSVDIGGTSSDDVIAAAAQGGGVKAIWSYAAPTDTIMLGGPAVKSAADLKGKTIGITDPGGFADSQARAVLGSAGVPASSVKFQSFPGRSAFVPALVAGKIDAAVFHVDDGLTAQSKSPNLNVVSKIWEAAPLWWYGAVTVRTHYAGKNQDLLQRFLQAMIEADRWMYGHRAEVVKIGVKYTQEDQAIVEKSYDFLAAAHEWTVNDGLRQNMVDYTVQTNFDNKQIDKKPTFDQVVDKTLINKVLASIGTEKTGF